MHRRDFLSSTALLALGSGLLPASSRASREVDPESGDRRGSIRRPNVVIIVADDTTPGYHGCYGGPTPTPQIDALAAGGLRVARGYCCSSLCSPSRYTIFTGRYTQRSPANLKGDTPADPALVSQTGELEAGQATLASVLRGEGYLTGHFGKWHTRFDIAEFGYDRLKFFAPDADDPGVDAALRREHEIGCDVVRRCAGFEVADRLFWGNIDAKKNPDPRLAAHNPAWITDGALEFVDRAISEGRPFYLHVANTVPHTPHCHLSLGMDHRYTWGGKLAAAPSSHPDDQTVIERLRAANLPTDGPFAGVNAGQIMIDDQIAALVAKLKAEGQFENTLFVYTADHGLSGKGSCHHIGQHLPLILHWPEGGLSGGRTVSEPFSWAHIAPTIAEACGATFPEGGLPDGVSLLPALRSGAPWPDSARVAYHEMGWSRSVIKGRYHYIATRYPEDAIKKLQAGDFSFAGIGLPIFDRLNATFFPGYFDAEQLYDLELDPLELNNLIGDRTRAAILADLRRELGAICAAMPRPFPAEPHPFQRTGDYLRRAAEQLAELSKIPHYPTRAKQVPAVVAGNYDDPDLHGTSGGEPPPA